ncbi:hypothetical protein DEO72_LG3g912 [Vigna unguiculata]|uniref:Uncharacterized protein n=1 Tax=Vigna unguiculata TaxID=3917 RepID=A0A4D6LCR9_VIGUN|nr:hypothetical protein DEO72_LG3g912 [Vigna unguiculata]
MDGVTCDDMSGEVHIKLLLRGDTSGEVRMFRAHVERCHVRGGTGAGVSHVLDYGRVGP